MLHHSRVAFSTTCAIACALVVALWIRSFWRGDVVQFGDQRAVASSYGSVQTLTVNFGNAVGDQTLVTFSQPLNLELPKYSLLGFGYSPSDGWATVVIPFWFPTLILATAAACPWVRWHPRFSLRTLFVVSTLIAVALGAAAYTVRLAP